MRYEQSPVPRAAGSCKVLAVRVKRPPVPCPSGMGGVRSALGDLCILALVIRAGCHCRPGLDGNPYRRGLRTAKYQAAHEGSPLPLAAPQGTPPHRIGKGPDLFGPQALVKLVRGIGMSLTRSFFLSYLLNLI